MGDLMNNYINEIGTDTLTKSVKDPEVRKIIPGYMSQLMFTVNMIKSSPIVISEVHIDLKVYSTCRRASLTL